MIIVGIAGPSGSGKSLLASTIINELKSNKVAVISEDRYYRDLGHQPIAQRAESNFDHPDAFEHTLLIEHLQSLKQGNVVAIPNYDHANHIRLTSTTEFGNIDIIILEGILLFVEPKLQELIDIKIFVDAPLDICLIRRLQRDINERARTFENVLAQYQKTVCPMYQKYVGPSKRFADIIVPKGGMNRIAINMIKAKLSLLLEKV